MLNNREIAWNLFSDQVLPLFIDSTLIYRARRVESGGWSQIIAGWLPKLKKGLIMDQNKRLDPNSIIAYDQSG